MKMKLLVILPVLLLSVANAADIEYNSVADDDELTIVSYELFCKSDALPVFKSVYIQPANAVNKIKLSDTSLDLKSKDYSCYMTTNAVDKNKVVRVSIPSKPLVFSLLNGVLVITLPNAPSFLRIVADEAIGGTGGSTSVFASD